MESFPNHKLPFKIYLVKIHLLRRWH